MPRGVYRRNPPAPKKSARRKGKSKADATETAIVNAERLLAEQWARRFLLNSYLDLTNFDSLAKLVAVAFLEGKLSALREENREMKKRFAHLAN